MIQPEIWSSRTVKDQMLPNFFKIPNYPRYPLTSSMRKLDYVHSKGTVVICSCKSFHLRLKSLKYKPTQLQYVTLQVSIQEVKERVSNGRGEEGLVGGGGVRPSETDGGGQECDLAQTHWLLYLVWSGEGKKWDKADSIKEEEQAAENKHQSWAAVDLAPNTKSLFTSVRALSQMTALPLRGHAAAGKRQLSQMRKASCSTLLTVMFSELSGTLCGNVVCWSQNDQSQDLQRKRDP